MIVRALKGILLFILGAACLIAVLRVFGWDPFGLVSWIVDAITYSITRLADSMTPIFHSFFGR